MKKYSRDKTDLIKIRISSILKDKLLNHCSENNITISEKIRELIIREVKNV